MLLPVLIALLGIFHIHATGWGNNFGGSQKGMIPTIQMLAGLGCFFYYAALIIYAIFVCWWHPLVILGATILVGGLIPMRPVICMLFTFLIPVLCVWVVERFVTMLIL